MARTHGRWRKLVRGLLISLVCFVTALPSARAITELGGTTFIKPTAEAQPLNPQSFARGRNSAELLAQNLNSYGYLSSVGGVAFGAVALCSDGIRTVDLHYLPEAEDGHRVRLTLDKDGVRRTFEVPLYHWQVAPIARLAATDQTACFTIFGRLADEREQTQRLARGEHILGYHPALRDTLLGWRLLQADLLIIRPDACDLPAVDGKYLVGAGEMQWLAGARPEVASNQSAFLAVDEQLRREPRIFTSYVVCDYQQEVRLSVSTKSTAVSLTGYPYWYCWRRKIDEPAAMADLQNRANARANELLRAEFAQDQARLSPSDFNRKWTPENQQRRVAEIFDQFTSAHLIQPLPELSHRISLAIYKQNGINPVVYESLMTTLRYTALFRLVRRENPDAYARFLQSLSEHPLAAVETPMVMIGPKGPTRINVRSR